MATKRAQISFQAETLNEWRKLSKEMNIPVQTLSDICESTLAGTVKTIKRLRAKKGKVTFADLFTLIGESLDDEMGKEVKTDDAKTAAQR